MEVVCLLVKAAVEGRDDGIWNKDGIYHPENGRMVRHQSCAGYAFDVIY